MSILHVNQIKNRIQDLFFTYLDPQGLSEGNEQILSNNLSKGLAAYAINALGVEVNPEILVGSLVDGSDDNGIDLIYFDSKTEFLYLVQSKWNSDGKSEPSSGDILKFTNGINDLLLQRYERFNVAVNNRLEELTSALSKPNIKLKVVLAYTAINQSDHSKNHFRDFCSDHNDISELIEVIIVNQPKLHGSLSQDLVESIDTQLTLQEWGKKLEPYKAFYGQISAYELAMLYKRNGVKLFRKNIRNLLGDTDINEELKETLYANNDLFWYFNNGITIVCDDAITPLSTRREYATFHCTNISIVNGAQTVGTLGSIYNIEDEDSIEILSNTFVPAKLITNVVSEPSSEEVSNFTELITKANNRQNKIEARDFVSLDRTQVRLQGELVPDGVHYIVLRGENEHESESAFELEECTGALSNALSVEASVRFKREKSLVWSDLTHKNYKSLFNDGTTGYYCWNTVKIRRVIFKQIDELIREAPVEDNVILKLGDELIGSIVFNLIDKSKISKIIFNYSEILQEFEIENKTKRVAEQLLIEVKGLEKVPQVIFKNFTECSNIASKIQNDLGKHEEEPQKISVEQEIELMPAVIRSKLESFYRKVSSNEIATEALEVILNELDSNQFEIAMVSNLHLYRQGNGPRSERFLFRFAYYTKPYIYFEYKNYGNEYTSLEVENPKVKALLKSKDSDNKRFELTSVSEIKEIMEILNETKR